MKNPKEGQEVFCKCPDFSPEGYCVAVFENGKFMREPNGDITEHIEEWMPLEDVLDSINW